LAETLQKEKPVDELPLMKEGEGITLFYPYSVSLAIKKILTNPENLS